MVVRRSVGFEWHYVFFSCRILSAGSNFIIKLAPVVSKVAMLNGEMEALKL
jgi:hypothetical protein